MRQRLFYAISVGDEQIRSYLDTIRLICAPHANTSAHVTIRGPYQIAISLERIRSILDGLDVSVVGIGSFFEEGQNTVFFRCGLPRLSEVWHKPDFPRKNPHLTLYDGNSREEAERYLAILGARRWFFSFPVGTIQKYRAGQNVQRNLDLAFSINKKFIASEIGSSISWSELSNLTLADREGLLDRVSSAFLKYVGRVQVLS